MTSDDHQNAGILAKARRFSSLMSTQEADKWKGGGRTGWRGGAREEGQGRWQRWRECYGRRGLGKRFKK